MSIPVFFDHTRHRLIVDGLDLAPDVVAFHGHEHLSQPFSYSLLMRLQFWSGLDRDRQVTWPAGACRATDCTHRATTPINLSDEPFDRFTGISEAVRVIRAWCFLVCSLWLLAGCGPKEPEFVPGSLGGVNHTSEGVNWYSVNGWGGRNVPPHSMYGGGTCCIPMPLEWEPGIMFTVKWETDPDPYAPLPKMGGKEFRDAAEKHEKGYRLHKKVIELPKYSEDGLCSLEVHFMPCNEIKFSTSCWRYPSPDGPIQDPLEMPEPAVCPK